MGTNLRSRGQRSKSLRTKM